MSRTFDIDDLSLGDLCEHARTAIKAAASDVLRLSSRYTREGCATHVAALRAAHGSLTEALRSFDHAVESAARELAASLEKTLDLQKIGGEEAP